MTGRRDGRGLPLPGLPFSKARVLSSLAAAAMEEQIEPSGMKQFGSCEADAVGYPVIRMVLSFGVSRYHCGTPSQLLSAKGASD